MSCHITVQATEPYPWGVIDSGAHPEYGSRTQSLNTGLNNNVRKQLDARIGDHVWMRTPTPFYVPTQVLSIIGHAEHAWAGFPVYAFTLPFYLSANFGAQEAFHEWVISGDCKPYSIALWLDEPTTSLYPPPPSWLPNRYISFNKIRVEGFH